MRVLLRCVQHTAALLDTGILVGSRLDPCFSSYWSLLISGRQRDSSALGKLPRGRRSSKLLSPCRKGQLKLPTSCLYPCPVSLSLRLKLLREVSQTGLHWQVRDSASFFIISALASGPHVPPGRSANPQTLQEQLSRLLPAGSRGFMAV